MRIVSLNILLVTVLCVLFPRVNASPDPKGKGERLPRIINFEEFVATVNYPNKCRLMGIEGTVVIRLLIDAEGKVERYRILAAPDDLMKKECVSKIKRLKFMPARDKNNKAVPAYVDLPIVFDLT